jgi:hypothetical protein
VIPLWWFLRPLARMWLRRKQEEWRNDEWNVSGRDTKDDEWVMR